MTPNDTQMDVLMRRYARGAKQASAGTEHLDADELNAFAEGALPAATRSSYVSHLADCNDCRQIVSQLAMATGAVANAQVPASEAVASRSWLQSLGALFSARALRYAASALVLVALVGISFVVWRRNTQQRDAAMIARNESNANQVSAVNPSSGVTETRAGEPAEATRRAAETTASATPSSNLDKSGSLSADAPPPPPKPAKDAADTEAAPVMAKAPAETALPQSSPSYAPPPPGENYRVDNRQREQQNIGNIHGGPRRNESQEKLKSINDRSRTADLAKGCDEDRSAGR